MVSPREKRLLTTLGIVFFAGAFLIDFGDSSQLIGLMGDAVHVPLFALMAGAIHLFLSQHDFSREARLVVAALLSIVLAFAIELLQPYFGRSQSNVDLENGVIGSLIGACGIALYPARTRLAVGGFATAAVIAVLGALLPAWTEWRALQLQHAQFPLLADFEKPLELTMWSPIWDADPSEQLALSTSRSKNGKHSLKVITVPGRSSGVVFRLNEMAWRRDAVLELSVFNPGKPFELELRVDDYQDCSKFDRRFNRSFHLAAGWNELALPVAEIELTPSGRPLQIQRLDRILLFTAPSPLRRAFYLDHLRLIEKPAL